MSRAITGGSPRDELLARAQARQELLRRRTDEAIRYFWPGRDGRRNEPQWRFVSSDRRNHWYFGGNRTGKTVAGAVRAVGFALGRDGAKYYAQWPDDMQPLRQLFDRDASDGWVVSLTFEVQRDVAQQEILRWLPTPEVRHISYRQSGVIDIIRLRNGRTIGFKSCDQGRDKFQGTSKGWIWFDEEPPSDIYQECQMRVMDQRGYMWGTMTPLLGLTWVYDTIYLNEAGDPEAAYEIASWDDNPFLDDAEKARLLASMHDDPAEREARTQGLFFARSGLIYNEWRDDGPYVCDPFDIPDGWRRVRVIDPGYTNPFSCLWFAIDGDGRAYIYDEHYEREQKVAYHARVIRAKSLDAAGREPHMLTLIDPAASQRTAAAEKSVIELLGDHGVHCVRANNEVWSGIQRVKDLLKLKGDGKPGVVVFRTCEAVRREFKSYRWAAPARGSEDRKNAPEAPAKVNDHAMDCIRYFANEQLGPPRKGPAMAARPKTVNKYTGY